MIASHVDLAAVEAARAYGPPPAGARTVWLQNSKGDYRFCVLSATATTELCGPGARILPLWHEDGRWNSTGWLEGPECTHRH